jgi:pyruvate-formate lyase
LDKFIKNRDEYPHDLLTVFCYYLTAWCKTIICIFRRSFMIDRTGALKQDLIQKRQNSSSAPRVPHWYYLEGFAAAIDQPFEVREAKARLNFYQNVPIQIQPGEMIVGQIDWNEPLVCTVTNTRIREDVLDKVLAMDLPGQQKSQIREWVDLARPFCFDPYPHLTGEERRVHASHLAPSTFFNGHIVPDYGYILRRGFAGVIEDIQRYRDRPLSPVEQNFYEAMEITTRGLSTYISRYADLAQELLMEGQPGYDPDQLKHIHAACAHFALGPARTFAEALQMVWFLMCFVDYDSFGRTDQYLLPYYQASRDQGMSEAEALLWLKYTWIKIEECGGILNMTIGGRQPDGSSAVNPLTYLIMRATREMGFRSPNLSLRIRAGDPQILWEAAHCAMSTGQGLPALYNDDLIVPMLVDMGYPEAEALDYCLAGCSQVILGGRSNFACDVGCYNLLKALELALHDGYDVLLGEQVGPRTGSIETLDTYEKLKAAYDRQMRYMTRLGVSINDKDTYLRQREGACVRSLLVMDCLERGQGIFHGGARYYGIQNEACGITNTANALHAIQELVFQENLLTLRQLVQVLDSDWAGEEALRVRFRTKADKFGNGKSAVDDLRAEIAADWYKEIQQYPAVYGGFHWPGEVVFVYHELHGAHTAASADGRKCGEPLASSAGASSGTDISGPTALLNSMLRISQAQCRTCCVLNLRFSKKLWNENNQAMSSLIRAYFAQGGFQVQVNLFSREELLQARQRPDEYANLVVRVGGFSDYFVRLPDRLQAEILSRTELEI